MAFAAIPSIFCPDCTTPVRFELVEKPVRGFSTSLEANGCGERETPKSSEYYPRRSPSVTGTILISTRRFAALPASVAFVAIGWVSP